MKIYFCDLCNESIKQEDLENSRVTTARGKMICAKCVPPQATGATGAPLAVPAAATRGGNGFAVALIALAGLGVGGAGLFHALDARARLAAQPDLRGRLDGVEKTLDRLLEDGAATRGRVETIATRVEKFAGEPPALREALADQLHRIEAAERANQEITALLGSLRSDREVVQRLELVQGRFEHDLAELKNLMQGLAARVTAIGSAPLPTGAGNGSAAAAAVPSAAPVLDAESTKLIAELASKDEGVRWQAVDRLAKKRDAAIVPHLLPLLSDSDTFVKFRVISAMRELNARSAVGRLIKLLRDGELIVREEAQDALVALTGNNQRFNVVDGTPSDREKGVKAWEEWFEKNKERFAEESSSS